MHKDNGRFASKLGLTPDQFDAEASGIGLDPETILSSKQKGYMFNVLKEGKGSGNTHGNAPQLRKMTREGTDRMFRDNRGAFNQECTFDGDSI